MPHRQRLTEETRSLLRTALRQLAQAAVPEYPETLEVELRGIDLERVARRPGEEHSVRLELLSEPRDVLLKGGLRIGGRVVSPQLVNEAVARDGLPGMEKKDREHASLPDAAEPQFSLAVEHLERPKNAEVEPRRQAANVPRCAVRSLTAP